MPVTFSYFFQIGILLLFGCRGSFVVPHTGYYEDGKVKEHGTFRDGEKHGESIAFTHIGHLPPRPNEIPGPVPTRVVIVIFNCSGGL